MVFKSWKSLEKNTEGKKERGGGERMKGEDGETEMEKRNEEEGGGFTTLHGIRSSYKLKVSPV